MHGRQAKSHNSAPSKKRQADGGIQRGRDGAPHHQGGPGNVRRPQMAADGHSDRGRDRLVSFLLSQMLPAFWALMSVGPRTPSYPLHVLKDI